MNATADLPLEDTDHPQLPRPRAEWAAVLSGPVAWFVQFVAIYALATLVCVTGGVIILHVVALLGLAMAAAGGSLAFRNWRLSGSAVPSDFEAGKLARARMMSVIGMMSSALYGVIIIAQWFAVFFLEPCAQ